MVPPLAIAVIDDDRGYLRWAKRRFRERARVDCFATGAEFLAHFDSVGTPTGGYDAVIVDRIMPGMTAHSILLALRERGAITAVVVVTAAAFVEDAVDSLRAGALDHIDKIEIKRVTSAVEEAAAVTAQRLAAIERGATSRELPLARARRLAADDTERDMLRDALLQTRGSVTDAAARLREDRKSVRRRLKRQRLTPKSFRPR